MNIKGKENTAMPPSSFVCLLHFFSSPSICSSVRLLFFVCCVAILMGKIAAVPINSLPELLPLDGQQSRIRIPLGTKVFKLKCPVKVDEDQSSGDQQQPGETLLIKWSKDGELLTDDGDHFRVQSNAGRDLRIRTPQVEDSGRYRCTAINEWGHRMVDFELEVFDPNSVQGKGPLADGWSSLSENVSAPKWRDPLTPRRTKVQLTPDSALHLRCPPSVGNPLPQVIWTREGVPVSLELINPNAASFSLDKVRPSDSAVYSCKVQNQLGSIQADFVVQVGTPASEDISDDQILFGSASSGTFSPSSASSLGSFPLPPTPHIGHRSQHENGTASVRAGLTAQLLCRVEWRREKSVIRWLRLMDNVEKIRMRQPNATIVRLGEMTFLVLDQGSDAVRVEMDERGDRVFINELRIPNVQKQDSGRYFCVVTNPAGQFVFRSAFLRVLDSPSNMSLLLLLSASPRLVLLLLILVLLILTILCCFACRSPLLKSFCCHSSPSLCCPRSANTTTTNSSNGSASNTFASSASASLSVPGPKFGTSSALLPPAPPRMPPPPLFPPPSVSFAVSPAAPFWPPFPNNMNTLEGHQQQKVHSLHKTEKGEDEMSRMSSHIYGVIDLSATSGSPLPTPHQTNSPPIYCHPPTANLSTAHWNLLPQPLSPPQRTKFSPEHKRTIGNDSISRRTNKEQKVPLIEAHRESLECWQH